MDLPTAGPARLSLLVLLIANAVVLWGVLANGWDVFAILFLFWLENVIVGLFHAARLLVVRPSDPAAWGARLFLVPFFCVHYGLFTMVHGVFVIELFGGASHAHLAESVGPAEIPAVALQLIAALNLAVPAAALAASHAFSFAWNFVARGEYRDARPRSLMMRPYGRVIALHVTILAGGGLTLALGSPLWALLLLLLIKTAMDARAHVREHRAADATSGERAAESA